MREGPRAASGPELSALIRLANEVFQGAGDFDMGSGFPTLFCGENIDNLRVVAEDGRPVSLAGYTLRDIRACGAQFRVACVGAVCTQAAHRGQGIAAAIMDDLIAAARAKGAVAILVSGGRGLYRRIGCIDAGLWRVVHVDASSRLPALEYAAGEWGDPDVPEMAALYQAEPVRFVRDCSEMRLLLEARSLHSRPARTWVVRAAGTVAAYLCTSVAGTDARTLDALECAGSRAAVLAAVPSILAASGAERISIETSAADIEMEGLARAHGLSIETRGFHGTLLIIDPRGFLGSLQAYFDGRLSTAERAGLEISFDQGVRFKLAAEELRCVTPPDLAALVFGSVERPAQAGRAGGTGPQGAAGRQSATGPLGADSPLGALLGRLFPIPLPVYGLNYI
jgi:GNAT superfamily N-acetyltransferase